MMVVNKIIIKRFLKSTNKMRADVSHYGEQELPHSSGSKRKVISLNTMLKLLARPRVS